MAANPLQRPAASPAATLAGFLRDRRARLQPASGAAGRRRTPGLRREEVATRAGVSVTWYTWLEQGRGGTPSNAVLERLAQALELDPAGREMMFLLAQQRPPPLKASRSPQVSPAVQHMIDAMPTSAAMVKTTTWDVLAWNAAAAALMGGDASGALPTERNSLRHLFLDPASRTRLPDWEENARFAVAAFRIDAARLGGSPEVEALIAELSAGSPDFRRLWAENEVRRDAHGLKRFRHPQVGAFTLEVSTYTVDSAEGLSLLVFTPLAAADVRAMEALIARRAEAA